MNVCSEETVVGEFEVRYPILCEWLQWSLRVLRKEKISANFNLADQVRFPESLSAGLIGAMESGARTFGAWFAILNGMVWTSLLVGQSRFLQPRKLIWKDWKCAWVACFSIHELFLNSSRPENLFPFSQIFLIVHSSTSYQQRTQWYSLEWRNIFSSALHLIWISSASNTMVTWWCTTPGYAEHNSNNNGW